MQVENDFQGGVFNLRSSLGASKERKDEMKKSEVERVLNLWDITFRMEDSDSSFGCCGTASYYAAKVFNKFGLNCEPVTCLGGWGNPVTKWSQTGGHVVVVGHHGNEVWIFDPTSGQFGNNMPEYFWFWLSDPSHVDSEGGTLCLDTGTESSFILTFDGKNEFPNPSDTPPEVEETVTDLWRLVRKGISTTWTLPQTVEEYLRNQKQDGVSWYRLEAP